jgi:hypothetical protein
MIASYWLEKATYLCGFILRANLKVSSSY